MTTRSSAKKKLQSFHARTTLWKLFEIRAQEMDCSIDYLINEAMRQYATNNSFLQDFDTKPRQPAFEPRKTTEFRQASDSGLPRPSQVKARSTIPPAVPRPRASGAPAPPPIPSMPPSQTGRQSIVSQVAVTDAKRERLTLVFQGQKIPIIGNQFVIGRGAKASDLTIKDPNISRKHAAVMFHNGSYYLKDLGSTNGVEYNGQRVDSKRIDEGDVFSICDHDLHFTFSV
jgi:pSer/pThr/pTyr-binding forkhead associated (FHA) protein